MSRNSQQQDHPRFTIIIPTRNAAPWLDRLLAMLARQSLAASEILIIDSSSTDATPEIAQRHGTRLVRIPAAEFDHGTTRSMAAEMAHSDLLLYMTQDAIPADEWAVERLIRGLIADERIGAAYGRQLPAADATVFGAHLRLFNYPDRSAVRCWKDRKRYGFRTIFISNSFAAYRKEILAAHGYFPDRQLFGEDTCTVAKFLQNGYCVAYVADACVYHSHNYTVGQDFRRYFDIGVFHACHQDLLDTFGSPGGAGRKYVRSEIALVLARKKWHLLPECILRNLGKWVAYNLGRRFRRLPRRLAVLLSMHRAWWHKGKPE